MNDIERKQMEMDFDRLYSLYKSGKIQPAEARELARLNEVLTPIWQAETEQYHLLRKAEAEQAKPMIYDPEVGVPSMGINPVAKPLYAKLQDLAYSNLSQNSTDNLFGRPGSQNLLDREGLLGILGVRDALRLVDAFTNASLGNTDAAAADVGMGALGLLNFVPAGKPFGAAEKGATAMARRAGMTEGMIDVADNPIARQYFVDRLTAAQASHGPIGKSVDVYSPDEYAGLRMAMTPEGDAGYAVKPTGEIVSVLKHKQSPVKDFAGKTMRRSEEQGGTWLNAFDTTLPGLYNRGGGFQPVARLPFSEEVARESWGDPATEAFMRANAKFNAGRPDVVFMARDPMNAAPVSPGQGGATIDDWDLGIKMVQDYLKELGYVVPQN